jgi:hypothetical protein
VLEGEGCLFLISKLHYFEIFSITDVFITKSYKKKKEKKKKGRKQHSCRRPLVQVRICV